MRTSYEKPQPPQDEDGIPIINTPFVKGLCRAYGYGMYETPHLNEKLYLHFYGFRRISGLEEYPNIKTLYLEGNAIQKIENLGHMKNLRCLFLQNNNIKEIKGLESLSAIHTLNLANNLIKKVEGLSHMTGLNSLDLSGNAIEFFEDYEQLSETPSVEALTLNGNKIDSDERIFDVLKQIKRLKCLYLKDNPIVRNLSYFRKKMIVNLEISYLDDQPVWEEDRRLARAWFSGGREAEQAEREKIRFEKNLLHKQYVNEIRKNEEQARQRRFMRLQEQEEDLIQQTEALKRKRAQERENKKREGSTEKSRDGNTEEIRENSLEKTKAYLADKENMRNTLRIVGNTKGKEVEGGIKRENGDGRSRVGVDVVWSEKLLKNLDHFLEKNEFDFEKTANDLNCMIGEKSKISERDVRMKWKEIEIEILRDPENGKESKKAEENFERTEEERSPETKKEKEIKEASNEMEREEENYLNELD